MCLVDFINTNTSYIMLAKNSYELNFSHNKKSYQFKNIRNLKDIKEQINSCAIYITFDTITFTLF